MKPYIILGFVLFISAAVNAWRCPVLKDGPEDSKLYEGQQKFTIKFLQEANKRNPNKSIFFSPYSIYRALLLAYFGSDGTTETSLNGALNLNWSHDKTEVLTAYKHEKQQHVENAKFETTMEFESVDKFFFDQTVEIRDCMKNVFTDEIELLDIHSQPEDSRQHINTWVEKITKNQIKDLLPPGSITGAMNLAIANAAYFKGDWLNKFNPEYTEQEKFYKTPTEHILVDMMKQTKTFHFRKNKELDCNIVELPYNRTNPNTNDITFVAILPTQNIENALGTMLNKMTPEIFSQMLTRTYRDQVDVWLPKFTIEQTTGLGSILNDMGFGQMFSHDADFSGFSETTKVLFSDAIHKAKIEVDELGTTAAAGTGLTLQSIPSLFIAEHPFFYMVYDHTAKMILFAGVYRGPE